MATRKKKGKKGSSAKTRAAEPAKAKPTPEPGGAEPARPAVERAHDESRFHVVGLGASAGGLDALEAFFKAVPDQTGVAFIVVTHQHPGHVSLLPELIAKHTSMPVEAITEGALVRPDRVLVSPPGRNVHILHGRLHLTELEHGPLPIDHFFRSLADDQNGYAVCVVLSGTGTDGTLGLREIKAQGGMAMVQDPASDHPQPVGRHGQPSVLPELRVRPPQGHRPAPGGPDRGRVLGSAQAQALAGRSRG